jgi:hypothetical protein
MKSQRNAAGRKSGAAEARARDAGAPALELDREEVARLAFSYWEGRGGQGGSAEEDWLRAEEALRQRLQPRGRAASASSA